MLNNILFILKRLFYILKGIYYSFFIGYVFDVSFKNMAKYISKKYSLTNLKAFIVGILKSRTSDEREATLTYLEKKYNEKNLYHWSYWLTEEGVPLAMPIDNVRMMLIDWSIDLIVNDAPNKRLANYYFTNSADFKLHVNTRRTIDLFLQTYCDVGISIIFNRVYNTFDDLFKDQTLQIHEFVYIKSDNAYYVNKTGKNGSMSDWGKL